MVVVTMKVCLRTQRHQWVAEASELGWRVGEWPKVISFEGGEGGPLILHQHRIDYKSGVHVYNHADGAELHIFND